MRVPVRSLATLGLAVGVATCADAPTVGRARVNPTNGPTGRAVIAMSPVFSKAAAAVYAQRTTFVVASFDHVHIVITRPPSEIVADTTIVFTPGSPPQSVDITVNGASTNEVFDGVIDYTNNGQVVYEGRQRVVSYPDGSPVPAEQPVVIVYVGPGASATRVAVTPKSVTVVAPGTATFTAAAFDASNNPVANTPIGWTVSDPTVATISAAGVLSTTGKRGAVTVTATSITGLSDNATATVTLPPTGIALVSGGGQTGKAGTTLPQAGTVKVTASDGVGVSGVTVNFAGPTGGGVGSASVTTSESGVASTTLTLGGTVGPQSFAASTGTFSVSIPATATPGDPSLISAASGGGQQDTVKKALASPFVAKVSDKFGNGVGGITVSWARTAGTGALAANSSVTGNDGSTSMGYTLGATPGLETVTASASGVTGSASFTAQALAAGPAAIAAVSGSGQLGRAQQPLAAPFVVRVTDAASNPVSGATVSWAATNGTISASTTTDGTGQSSNTMTLGATLGNASATATIGSGLGAKSVTFTATVQAGVVAQLAFRTGPPANSGVSTILVPPITVELRDAAGNLTAATNAVTVALGTNPGQATLGGTLTQNAVAGVATFNDLTVSAPGAGYTLVASSAGVPTVTSTAFTIGQVAAGKTWTGAVSTNWATPGNWSGSAVPVASDQVTIPANMPNAPVLTANVTVSSLSVAPGASLSLGTFTLTTGTVDGGTGPGISGTGLLSLTNGTFRGTISNVSVVGTVTQSGPATVTGALSVATGGTLTVNQSLTVGGLLSVSGANVFSLATLVIAPGAAATAGSLSSSGAGAEFSQTGGTLTVTGSATFDGNNFPNTITGGTLNIGGNFAQLGNVTTASFAATGTHTTVFNGSSAQTINFANPPSSHFQNLSLAGTGAVTLVTTGGAVSVTGQLISPTGATTVLSAGRSIDAAGLDVDGLVLDNTRLTSTGGTITRLDNVTFQNYSPTVTPLTISHPGLATPFTFNNVQFLVTPTSGSYLNVTDSNPNDGLVLTINLVNSTPSNGAAQTATSGGALVNWQLTGATIAWTSPSGGAWSTAANWSLGRVPAAGDSVVIALSGTYTVTIDTTFTGKAITLGAVSGTQTLVLPSRTLTLSGPLTVLANGVFAPSSGTLAGAGTLVNQGTVTLFYSTLTSAFVNQGLLIANGSSAINGPITTGAGSTIRLQPDGTTGFSNLTFANGFTNTASIVLTSIVGAYTPTLTVTNGTLTNGSTGTITSAAGTGGSRTINAQLDNQGLITVAQALSLNRANTAYTNTGTIDATAGDVTVNQGGAAPSFTNSNAITVGTGHTFTINGGTFNQTAGTIGGAGTLALTSTTANFTTNFTNATTALTLSSATVNGPGTFTNAPGKTLTLLYSTFGANATLDNQGTLVANGSSAINGTVTTAATSTIRLQPDGSTGFSNLTFANGFTNNGAIDLTSTVSTYSSTLTVTSGTLTNAAGATITSSAGTGGPRTLNAQFDNQGLITVAQPLTLSRASSVYTNGGTIDATAADVTVNQGGTTPSFTNSNTITVGPGHTLTINGGTFNQSAGTIGGAGTLALTSATANFTTNFTNATTALTLSSTTVNGPGTFTNAPGKTLTLLYSTFGANAALDNQGLLVANGTSAINGTYTNSAASILRLLPDGTTGFSSLTFANGFTNNGAIELTSAGSTYSSTLTVTSGTLTNVAGGTISSLVGAGGLRTLNAQFDNQGLITVAQALTLNRVSTAYTNSGTIDATAADVTVNQGGTTPSFTNSNTITVGPGHTFTINGGTFNQSAGTIGGAGTLALTSATANFTTNFTNATTALTLSSTTVNGPGTFTNAPGKTLTLLYSTFGANATLDNRGTLVANGTSGVNGTYTNTSTSILRLLPDGSTGFSNLTFANGFTNNGAIELTSAVSSYSSTLTVTSGTLTNALGSTISSLVGTGGLRTLNAQFDNQGLITVAQALTLNRVSTAYTNSGTIDATAADVTVNQGGTTPSFTNSNTITVGPGHTFTINGGTFNQTAGTIGGAGTLALTSATANFTTNFTNATTALTLSSTTVNGPGTFTNAPGKTLTMYYSTFGATAALDNQGLLVANGTSAINGTYTNSPTSILRLLPDGSTGFSNLTFANGFTNNGTIDLTSALSTYSATLTVTNGTLTNAAGGTITSSVGTGGTRTIAAQLVNQGAVTINQPLTLNRTSTVYSNTGTMDVNANLTINQGGTTPSFTNTGTLNIASGQTVTVNSGTFTQQSGTFGGAGATLTLNSVTTTFNTAFTLAALNVSGGSVTFSQNLSSASAALTFTNTTINGPGTLTNPSGQTLTLVGTTIAGSVPSFTNQGTLIVNGNTTMSTPSFVAAANSILRLQPDGTTGSSNLTVLNGFTNDGAIELTSTLSTYSSTLQVTNGTLTNSGTGTITSLVGTGGSRTITAQLVNQGAFTINQPLTLNRTSTVYSNTGTMDVNANLTINQGGTTPSFTNTGTLNIASGQTVTVNGGTFTQQSGTFGGAGATLTLSGVTTTFNTAFTLAALNVSGGSVTFSQNLSSASAALTFTSTTINGPGTLTNPSGQTLTLVGTTIAASVPSFTNQGTLIVNGNTTMNTPSFVAAANSILRLQPDGTTGGTNLTVANSFTNDGAIELTSIGSTYSSTLQVTTGSLTNSATGTITSLVGTGGSRTLTAQLINQGVMTINQPLGMNRNSSTHANTGTINVNAGLTVGGAAPNFTNSGAINIASGQTVTVNGGTFTLQAAGSITGGTLALSAVTATFNTGIAAATLNLSGNTNLTLSSAFSTATTAIVSNSATIGGTATITNPSGTTTTLTQTTLGSNITWVNQGTLIMTGGSSINGTLTTVAGSILRVDASSGASNLTFGAGLGFTNNGAVELTGTGGSAATITLAAGTLTNASGGTITSFANGTGGRVISGSVNNLAGGAITIASGGTGTLSITGTGNFTNAGTVNFKLNGTGAGQFDVLAVAGAASLGVGGPQGIMNVSLVSGFTPTTGSTFNVMTYASHSQSFLTTSFPPGAWTAAYNLAALQLTAP